MGEREERMSDLDYESDEGGFGFGNKGSDDEFESSWDGGNADAGSVVELEESVEEVRPLAWRPFAIALRSSVVDEVR